MKLSLGYITAPTKAEARAMVTELLAEGLIACANILPGAESHFVWKGEIGKATEVVIFLKTRQKNEEKIIKLVRKMHSYESPCITFFDLASGDPEFLKWIDKSC